AALAALVGRHDSDHRRRLSIQRVEAALPRALPESVRLSCVARLRRRLAERAARRADPWSPLPRLLLGGPDGAAAGGTDEPRMDGRYLRPDRHREKLEARTHRGKGGRGGADRAGRGGDRSSGAARGDFTAVAR